MVSSFVGPVRFPGEEYTEADIWGTGISAATLQPCSPICSRQAGSLVCQGCFAIV